METVQPGTPLRDGFYPTYQGRRYLSPGDRPNGFVSVTDWRAANQAKRYEMYDAVPDVRDMTDLEQTAYIHDMAMSPGDRAEIDTEVARDRARRELYGLLATDRQRYLEIHDSMTPAERLAYDTWEDMWSDLQDEEKNAAEAATAEKGVPAWCDLMSIGMSGDQDSLAAYASLMTTSEQLIYNEWAEATILGLEKTSTDLYKKWTPYDVNRRANEEHWNSYRGLSDLGKQYYDGWRAAKLAMRTLQDHKTPIGELYDLWKNTGENGSTAWQKYVSYFVNPANAGPEDYMQVWRLNTKLEVRKQADLRGVEIQLAGSSLKTIAGEALAMTLERYRNIFALRHEDPAAYQAAIDALESKMFMGYNLWEHNQDMRPSSDVTLDGLYA